MSKFHSDLDGIGVLIIDADVVDDDILLQDIASLEDTMKRLWRR